MKIAIPSNDELTISGHFGRTKGFMIYVIENNEVVKKEYKSNDFTGHAQGHHHEGEHGHDHQHSHAGIFSAIGDCDTVIAGGMGRRLYDEFKERQTNVFVTREASIETAISRFISGELDNNEDACCKH